MSLHRADEELRVSEAQTRAILDASLDCIIMMDAAGRVVEFNPAAERTFGWARDQVVGELLGELIVPPSLRFAHRSGLARYLETGTSSYLGRRVETTAMRADGSEFPIELTIVRIETTGSPMFTGTLRDISDRRALERDLRARVEELARERGLTDVISDTVASMIFVVESDGTHVKSGVNLPFERGMGLHDADLAGRRFPDTLIAREDADAARALLERVRVGQPAGEIESAWVTSDGERRRVSWTCAPIVDWHGRDALLVTGLDVTERRASESQLERFFELSSDMLATANAEGRFTRVNPAFERTLGYCSAELLAEPFMAFVHPDDRESTKAELAKLALGSPTRRFENRYRRRDGSYCWLEWSTMPDPDPESDLLYAVARDVTEAKQAEEELRRLMHEQAALRRVATLVARSPEQADIFARVSEEAGRLLGAQHCTLVRFEYGSTFTCVVARWTDRAMITIPVGEIVPVGEDTVTARLLREGCATRVDDYSEVEGELAARLRAAGVRSSVAAPIHVAGHLWGAAIASRTSDTPFPEGAELRLQDFADLVAQALANAEAHEQLAASRERIMQAADRERQRLERNLHDGAQQRLVSLSLALRLAQSRMAEDPEGAGAMVSAASDELALALDELRELARGIHPAILTERGLAAAVESLTARLPLPVALSVSLAERLPAPVENAAYYVVSEALANVVKYAGAATATISISRADGQAVIEVADDGVGGADAARGSGLRGLADRVEALKGHLEVVSPPDGGTRVRAAIPVR
jgi:PAS domain S-box-containing protein